MLQACSSLLHVQACTAGPWRRARASLNATLWAVIRCTRHRCWAIVRTRHVCAAGHSHWQRCTATEHTACTSAGCQRCRAQPLRVSHPGSLHRSAPRPPEAVAGCSCCRCTRRRTRGRATLGARQQTAQQRLRSCGDRSCCTGRHACCFHSTTSHQCLPACLPAAARAGLPAQWPAHHRSPRGRGSSSSACPPGIAATRAAKPGGQPYAGSCGTCVITCCWRAAASNHQHSARPRHSRDQRPSRQQVPWSPAGTAAAGGAPCCHQLAAALAAGLAAGLYSLPSQRCQRRSRQ